MRHHNTRWYINRLTSKNSLSDVCFSSFESFGGSSNLAAEFEYRDITGNDSRIAEQRSTRTFFITEMQVDSGIAFESNVNTEFHPDILDPMKYTRRRRAPLRPPTLKSDIYLSSSQATNATVRRAQDLLFKDNLPEITIHGLGAAVEHAVIVSRILTDLYGHHLKLHMRTSTVELIDDYEPLVKGLEFRSISRLASAIHIRICKQLAYPTQALLPVKRHFKRAPAATLMPVPLALRK